MPSISDKNELTHEEIEQLKSRSEKIADGESDIYRLKHDDLYAKKGYTHFYSTEDGVVFSNAAQADFQEAGLFFNKVRNTKISNAITQISLPLVIQTRMSVENYKPGIYTIKQRADDVPILQFLQFPPEGTGSLNIAEFLKTMKQGAYIITENQQVKGAKTLIVPLPKSRQGGNETYQINFLVDSQGQINTNLVNKVGETAFQTEFVALKQPPQLTNRNPVAREITQALLARQLISGFNENAIIQYDSYNPLTEQEVVNYLAQADVKQFLKENNWEYINIGDIDLAYLNEQLSRQRRAKYLSENTEDVSGEKFISPDAADEAHVTYVGGNEKELAKQLSDNFILTPAGHVYSENTVINIAKENYTLFVDPNTRNTFPLKDLKRLNASNTDIAALKINLDARKKELDEMLKLKEQKEQQFQQGQDSYDKISPFALSEESNLRNETVLKNALELWELAAQPQGDYPGHAEAQYRLFRIKYRERERYQPLSSEEVKQAKTLLEASVKQDNEKALLLKARYLLDGEHTQYYAKSIPNALNILERLNKNASEAIKSQISDLLLEHAKKDADTAFSLIAELEKLHRLNKNNLEPIKQDIFKELQNAVVKNEETALQNLEKLNKPGFESVKKHVQDYLIKHYTENFGTALAALQKNQVSGLNDTIKQSLATYLQENFIKYPELKNTLKELDEGFKWFNTQKKIQDTIRIKLPNKNKTIDFNKLLKIARQNEAIKILAANNLNQQEYYQDASIKKALDTVQRRFKSYVSDLDKEREIKIKNAQSFLEKVEAKNLASLSGRDKKKLLTEVLQYSTTLANFNQRIPGFEQDDALVRLMQVEKGTQFKAQTESINKLLTSLSDLKTKLAPDTQTKQIKSAHTNRGQLADTPKILLEALKELEKTAGKNNKKLQSTILSYKVKLHVGLNKDETVSHVQALLRQHSYIFINLRDLVTKDEYDKLSYTEAKALHDTPKKLYIYTQFYTGITPNELFDKEHILKHQEREQVLVVALSEAAIKERKLLVSNDGGRSGNVTAYYELELPGTRPIAQFINVGEQFTLAEHVRKAVAEAKIVALHKISEPNASNIFQKSDKITPEGFEPQSQRPGFRH